MHMTAEWRNKMLNKLLKSVLDQDLAPVVVCDIHEYRDKEIAGHKGLIYYGKKFQT